MAKDQFHDLVSASNCALNDPDTTIERLRELLADCAAALSHAIDDRARIIDTARHQLVELASMIEGQDAVWPEDVARLAVLATEIRQRALLFAED